MNIVTLTELIKEAVIVFSDGDFQRRIWKEGLGPEVDSYEDSLCNFFDGLAIDLFLECEVKKSPLKSCSIKNLNDLRDALNNFDATFPKDKYNCVNPEKLLNDPNWKNIQAIAKQCAHSMSTDLRGA